MKETIVPQRMCIVCRKMQQKENLHRIVKSASGEFCIDLSYKKGGRGAYVCKDASCIAKCIKTRAINRAFSCEVPREIYDKIAEAKE